jgi:sulfate permease, SulP family
LGGANVAAGLTQAFPVSCSGSRTAVADSNGAGSQVAGLVTAGTVALIAVFATGLLDPLPKAALGVVVIGAALTLFDFESVWRLRRVRGAEVALSVAATLGVFLFGVVGGVALAIGLSIGVFIYRVARPHDAVLGHAVDIDGYVDVAQTPTQVEPGLLVYRFDARSSSRTRTTSDDVS